MTGGITLAGPLGVGVTLDNRDAFMAAATTLEQLNSREARSAVAIALRARWIYEEKLVPAAMRAGKYSWNDEKKEEQPPLAPQKPEGMPDDIIEMASGIKAASRGLQSLWKRSGERYPKLIDYLENNGVFLRTHYLEKINQSVPWYSYDYGSWNLSFGFGKAEFNFVTSIHEGNYDVPDHVRDVIRKIYSLRHNLHEMIMSRGLFSGARQPYVALGDKKLQEINNAITEYERQYAGSNAEEWKKLLQAAKKAATEASDFIKYIHDRKHEGYIF